MIWILLLIMYVVGVVILLLGNMTTDRMWLTLLSLAWPLVLVVILAWLAYALVFPQHQGD